VEGKIGEFTRIELDATGNGLGDDGGEITILTDATDTSQFLVGRAVRVSFDFSSQTTEP